MDKLGKIIALTAVAFSVSLILLLSGVLDGFELKAYDVFSRNLNPKDPGRDIIIIQVDQRSVDALNDEGIRWPWPRQMYAPIIEFVSEADAVFIDILFTEPSSYGVEDDTLMAETLKASSNVFIPVFLTSQQKPLNAADMDFLRKTSLDESTLAPIRFKSAITPIEELEQGAVGGGNVTMSPDNDGVYRRVALVFDLNGLKIPNFAAADLAHDARLNRCGDRLCLDRKQIHLSRGSMLLRYYRSPFESFSAIDILRLYSGEDSRIGRDFFKGKKVFIGLTAAGLYDLKPTAVSSIATGVDIHATALQNLLADDYMRPLGMRWLALVMFLACLALCSVVLRYYSIYINLSAFALLIALGIAFPSLLFMNGIYIGIVPTISALMVAFIISASYSYAVEGRERRFTRRAFSQYMDTTLVEYLLENPELIKPGGQKKRVTVFFADLAGFTSLAEKIPAEQTARVLHRVLNSFTEAIINRKGVVDKYMGDAVMAFWGAPIAGEGDEINACLCALDCIEALREVNKSIKDEHLQELSARIGIHTGDAIAGNLGSDRLFDYTVIGDPVNLASRIESVNKLFGTNIIATEDSIQQTGDRFLLRELGLVEVKGKTEPIRVFEVISEAQKSTGTATDIVLSFNKAMALYSEGKWQEALEIFREVLKETPNDGPSKFYIDRCRNLLNAPYDGWTIIKLTEK